MTHQKYDYVKYKSILYGLKDEYTLTKEEYYLIHVFFVTNCMVNDFTSKSRDFKIYGWKDNNTNHKPLSDTLEKVLPIKNNTSYIVTRENNLKELFSKFNLTDYPLSDLTTERFVITPEDKTKNDNSYLILFLRIRNGLAHGNYKLVYSKFSEKMVIIQNRNKNNVTARIVLKLSTIINLIKAIDKNRLIK